MYRIPLALVVCWLTGSVLSAEVLPSSEQGALDQRYETDVREKVDEPIQASLRRLNESYAATLDAALKKVAAQGLLDETLALRNEAKRFGESNTVPEKDEPGTNAEVAKLRGFWRAESARLGTVRTAVLQPIQQAYVASLRILEKELTRALRIEEAKLVRAKVEAMTPATAPPATATAPAPARPATFARPVERTDLYTSGNNNSSIFLNGREIMKGVIRDTFSKARVSLKEGDVLTVIQNGRASDNFIWLSAISPSGDFLFETSPEWKCYLPENPAKWWDIKNIKTEQPVESISEESEYRHMVKRSAMATPLYHGTPPIHSVLKEGDQHQAMYFYHVVTKPDLLPKKIPAESVLTDESIPWIGKTVRIKSAKDAGRVIVIEQSQPKAGAIDSAEPLASVFKIARGTRLGTVAFETQSKPGNYLRHEGWRLHLLDKVIPDAEFCLEKPIAGAGGVSIAAAIRPKYHLFVPSGDPLTPPDKAQARGPRRGARPPEGGDLLTLSDKVQDESAVFFLEEVKTK